MQQAVILPRLGSSYTRQTTTLSSIAKARQQPYLAGNDLAKKNVTNHR
jgi:hypothetical protein